jgi:hypothetical protein
LAYFPDERLTQDRRKILLDEEAYLLKELKRLAKKGNLITGHNLNPEEWDRFTELFDRLNEITKELS